MLQIRGKPVIFFKRKDNSVKALYAAIVAAARQPKFYADWHVPDTVDGRFDMVVLHLYLVLGRLKLERPALCQQLTDAFCSDMDANLREMGAGDLSVGKKVRRMAEALFGRIRAYEMAVNEAGLEEALNRNVYSGGINTKAAALARWVTGAKALLAAQGADDIGRGNISFP